VSHDPLAISISINTAKIMSSLTEGEARNPEQDEEEKKEAEGQESLSLSSLPFSVVVCPHPYSCSDVSLLLFLTTCSDD